MKKNDILLAMAATAGILGSTEALANEDVIRIGILDVRANSLTFEDKKTKIWYREDPEEGKFSSSWQTSSGYDHGKIVASAFVRQLREIDKDKNVYIFSANVFQENSNPSSSAMYSRNDSKRTLSINWKGAERALEWFKESGVRVVLTAFIGKDTPQMRSFKDKALELGLVVVAGAGNADTGKVYPAAYPEVISVAANNKGLAFRKDKSISEWVNFTIDGGVPIDKTGPQVDEGSSYSSAKLAAYASYFSEKHNENNANKIRQALYKVSEKKEYDVNSSKIYSYELNKESSKAIATVQNVNFSQITAHQNMGR
jgi:hypothetical protein